MRYKELLEAPIADVNLHGELSTTPTYYGQGFDKVDRTRINDPQFRQKLIGKWAKTKVPVYVNFIDAYIKKPEGLSGGFYTIDEFREIEKHVNINIPVYMDGINFIMTKNDASNKMPISSWIIAHRIAERSYYSGYSDKPWARLIQGTTRYFEDLVYFIMQKCIPKKNIKYGDRGFIVYSLLTMRSSRIKHPTVIVDPHLELFSQYMVTGDFHFDISNLIKNIEKIGIKLTDKNINLIDEKMVETKTKMKESFDEFIEKATGHVLVY